METIIKILPEELDMNLLNKIKQFINNKKNVDVTISLKEFDAVYRNELNDSIEDAESGKDIVSFSMKEFLDYSPNK